MLDLFFLTLTAVFLGAVSLILSPVGGSEREPDDRRHADDRRLSAGRACRAPPPRLSRLGLMTARALGGSAVPIVVVSVRAHETEGVAALDHGAAAEVTTPFGMGELLTRLRTAVRHRWHPETTAPVFRAGELTVDLVRRVVSVDGHGLSLTPRHTTAAASWSPTPGQGSRPGTSCARWGSGGDARDPVSAGVHRATPAEDRGRSHATASVLTEPGVGSRLRPVDEDSAGRPDAWARPPWDLTR